MPVGERKLNAHVLKQIGSLGAKRKGHGAILEAVCIGVRGNSNRLVEREGGVETRVEGVAKVEAVARDKDMLFLSWNGCTTGTLNTLPACQNLNVFPRFEPGSEG